MPRQRTARCYPNRDKASECAPSAGIAGMIAAANESLDDLYLARGVACWNMWDYGCYFARRNDRHLFGPQIPWRLECQNQGGTHVSSLRFYTRCSRGAIGILKPVPPCKKECFQSVCLGYSSYCLDAFGRLVAQLSIRTIQKQRPTFQKVCTISSCSIPHTQCLIKC